MVQEQEIIKENDPLEDEDPQARYEALETLLEDGSPGAVEKIIGAL